jgi:hypothetical protein
MLSSCSRQAMSDNTQDPKPPGDSAPIADTPQPSQWTCSYCAEMDVQQMVCHPATPSTHQARLLAFRAMKSKDIGISLPARPSSILPTPAVTFAWPSLWRSLDSWTKTCCLSGPNVCRQLVALTILRSTCTFPHPRHIHRKEFTFLLPPHSRD